MTVFIDYVFIENILYNLVVILQTSFLSKYKSKKVNMGISSVVGSVYVCIMIWLQLEMFNYFWSKLILSFVIVYIAFLPKTMGEYLKLIGIYYLATIINVGGCIVVAQMMVKEESISLMTKIAVYMISLSLTYLYTKQFWKVYKNNLSGSKLIHKVTINIGSKEYTYNGFLDTGNTVKSYELGVPVVFAEYVNEEQRLIVKNLPKYSVAVSTISKQSDEQVILIKKAKIGKNTMDFGVVFVEKKLNKNNKYNMILNYELFEDVLGGICI